MPLPCPPSLEDKGLISALTTKSGLNAYVLDFRGHSKVMHSYETFELKRERKILTCNIFFSIISFSINYICKDKGLIFVVHTYEKICVKGKDTYILLYVKQEKRIMFLQEIIFQKSAFLSNLIN